MSEEVKEQDAISALYDLAGDNITGEEQREWRQEKAGIVFREIVGLQEELKALEREGERSREWKRRFDDVHDLVSPETDSTVTEVLNRVAALREENERLKRSEAVETARADWATKLYRELEADNSKLKAEREVLAEGWISSNSLASYRQHSRIALHVWDNDGQPKTNECGVESIPVSIIRRREGEK